jgi:hypothetical protein
MCCVRHSHPKSTHLRHKQLSPCDLCENSSQSRWAQSICHAALHFCQMFLAFVVICVNIVIMNFRKIMMIMVCSLPKVKMQSYISLSPSSVTPSQAASLWPCFPQPIPLLSNPYHRLSSPTCQCEEWSTTTILSPSRGTTVRTFYFYYNFWCFAERRTKISLYRQWHSRSYGTS